MPESVASTAAVSVSAGPPPAHHRLLVNSRWNLAAFAASVLASFIALPLAIGAVGLPAFGAAGLALAVFAPCTLVGTVVGQALLRGLAPLLAADDREGARRLTAAALALAGLGCAVVLALLAPLASWLLLPMLSRETSLPVHWSLAVALTAAGWLAQQALLLIQAVAAATQKFARLSVGNAIGALAGAVALVFCARWWPGVEGFIAGTALAFALQATALAALLAEPLGWLLRLRRWQPSEWRALQHFGRWQGANQLVGALGNQADRYVLGAVASLPTVGQFNVAMRLQEVVHMGLLKATEVLYPHFSVTADRPATERAAFYMRCTWLLNLLAVAGLAPLVPLAEPLIRLWVSEDAAAGGATMLHTLALAGIVGAGSNVYGYLGLAVGQAPQLARIAFWHAAVLAVCTCALLLAFGPLLAGAGYLLANIVRLALTLRLGQQHFGNGAAVGALWRSTLPPLVGGGVAALGLLAGAPWNALVGGWVALALAYAACAAASLAAAVAASACTHEGRAMLREARVWVQQHLRK